jgi:hypothetical protein
MRMFQPLTNGIAVQSDAPSKILLRPIVFRLTPLGEGEKAAAAIVVAGEYKIQMCDVEGC